MKKAIYAIRDRKLPEQIRNRIPEEWSGNSFIPPGWQGLVCLLDDELAKIAPDYVLHQVKSKFGTLRYYIDKQSVEDLEAVNDVIRKYENIADNACEVCGQPGTRGTNKWAVTTRCEDHKE